MKKNTLLPIIFSLALLSCSGEKQNRADAIMAEIDNPSGKVMVLAHRGDWRNAPENSLLAYDYALQMGAHLIEVDVQESSDSVLINMHDSTLGRTTTGKGKISDFTAAQIQELILRDGHNYPTHHHPCTVEEVLTRYKDKCVIILDKADGHYKEIYELAKKTGSLDQIIIKAYLNPSEYDQESLEIMKKLRFMPCLNIEPEDSDKKIEAFIEMGASGFEMTYTKENEKIIDSIHKVTDRGLCFISTTLLDEWCGGRGDDRAVENGEEDECWGHLSNIGANIFQTDRPAQLIGYFKKKGLYY